LGAWGTPEPHLMLLLLTSSCLTICPCSVHSYSLLLYLGAALPWMRWTYVCIPRCSTWHAPPHPCFTLDALAICIPFCTQPGMLYPIRAPPGLPLCSMLNLACSTPSVHYLGCRCFEGVSSAEHLHPPIREDHVQAAREYGLVHPVVPTSEPRGGTQCEPGVIHSGHTNDKRRRRFSAT
jgi:hypothetical protein